MNFVLRAGNVIQNNQIITQNAMEKKREVAGAGQKLKNIQF
jgi:hypothetical protein